MSAVSDLAAETRLRGGGLSTLPRVNLLPPEIAERAQFRKVQGGLAAAVLLAIVGTGLLYVGATGSVSSAQDRVDATQSETQTLQRQTAALTDVKATYASAEAAQKMLSQAMSQEVRYSRFLSDLSLSIPDNVWITNLAFTQAPPPTATTTAAAPAAPAVGAPAVPVPGASVGTVTVTGIAFDHDNVATWLESLAKQKGYTGSDLQTSTKSLLGSRTVVTWTTSAVLTPAALSGRYTTPAGG